MKPSAGAEAEETTQGWWCNVGGGGRGEPTATPHREGRRR